MAIACGPLSLPRFVHKFPVTARCERKVRTMPPRAHGSFSEGEASPFRDLQRTVDFWARASTIYGSYKVTQLKALGMRLQGKGPDEIKQTLWIPQHKWAGSQMYALAVTLRGFYLKVMAMRQLHTVRETHRPLIFSLSQESLTLGAGQC